MGGSDDPSNLIELTIEEHAAAHLALYEEHGRWQDKLAWQGLSGQIGKEEVIRLAKVKANSIPKPHLSKLYKERCADGTMVPPTLNGKDNPRARSIIAEGTVYDTIRACADTYGMNHNAIRYRLNSNKWTEWNYET